MAEVKWLAAAQNDLKRLYDFLQPHSAAAAQKAILTILDAVDMLGEFPEAGKPWDYGADFREWPIRFGAKAYVIRYRLFENDLIIVRVWHSLEDK